MLNISGSNFGHRQAANRRNLGNYIKHLPSRGDLALEVRVNVIKVVLFVFVFCLNGLAHAASPQDTFRMANEAMRSGATQDAIQLYQMLADRNFASLELYYNLGTAYALQKDLASARLYLERAYLMDPRNEQIRSNLAMVKSQIDDVYHYPSYPFFSTIETVHSMLGQNFLSLCLLILLSALALLLWLKSKDDTNVNMYLYVVVGCILLVVMSMLVERTYTSFHKRMAIVHPNTAPMFERPEVTNKRALDLASGYKVRINEEVGPWLKVDLADGTPGWIERQYVKKIIN